MTKEKPMKKIFKRLSMFTSAIAGKPIHVTSQKVLPKNIRELAPRVALTDGSRIYLPESDASLTLDQQETLNKQYCLEKVIEIERRSSNQSASDFGQYKNQKVAESIFNILEGSDVRAKARERFPSAFQEPLLDDYEMLKNFAKASQTIGGKAGKKLRKAALRYTTIAQQGKINPEISQQFVKRIYDSFNIEKLKQEKQPQDLQDLLSFLGMSSFEEGDESMGSKLEQVAEGRNSIKQKIFLPNDQQDDLEDAIDEAIESINGGEGAGPKDFEKIKDYINNNQRTTDKIHSHPSTILSLASVERNPNADRLYDNFLSRYQIQIRAIKNKFERLKRTAMHKLKRQSSGDEVEIDAAIDFMISPRNKEHPENKVYTTMQRNRRDIYAAILLDVSGSTSGTKINSIRETAAMLTEALEHIGDRYMIYAFGDKLYAVKSPNESNPLTRKNIFSLTSGGGTPQADATRDITSLFRKINAKTKVLFTIGDGSPDNVEETKKSLLEARAQGIRSYSITVDPHGEDYLKQLFGDSAYCICPNPEELPEKAGRFYKQVAF